MNKKLEFKHFDLRSVKVNSKKGLDVTFFDLTLRNDLLSISSDSVPHEDFFASIDRLKEFMCKSLGLHSGWNFSREHLHSNHEALKIAIDGYKEEVERCNVSGFKVVGSGDNEGIKITGSLACDFGSVGLASPTIKYNELEVNDGEEVFGIVEEIGKEIWAFIYKGKRDSDLFSSEFSDPIDSGLNNLKVAL